MHVSNTTGAVDDPERARLRKLQPGEDGGRPKTRKASNWEGYDHGAFDRAPRKVRKVVIRRCLRAMKAKTKSNKGQSEPDYAETIDGYRDTLLECKSRFALAVAALLPTTYTQTITLLEHTGDYGFFNSDGESLRIYDSTPPTLGGYSCAYGLARQVAVQPGSLS